MGTRDQYETVTGVVKAFADSNVWKQAELARHLQIESRRLRTILENLKAQGMPLVNESEHPHVLWSVPKKWFPGGVFFELDDWEVLVQAVLHIRDPKRRKALLTRLLNGRIMGSVESGIERLEQGISGLPVSPEVQKALLEVQQALLLQKPLTMLYYSVTSGSRTERVISPQRLFTEPHARLVAYCHLRETLRWFRLDNIAYPRRAEDKAYQKVTPEELTTFIASSPDGYHDGTATEWSFVVSPKAAAWVRGNLLPGMHCAEESSAGLRVTARGGALVVARFIASLGGEAVAQQESLREHVCEIARRSVEKNGH
jgi:predicted DNA-binding transcriptional regulator YafY